MERKDTIILVFAVVAVLTAKPTVATSSFDTFLVVNDGINPVVSGENIVYYRTESSRGLYHRGIWGTGMGGTIDRQWSISTEDGQLDFSGDIVVYIRQEGGDHVVVRRIGGGEVGLQPNGCWADQPRVDNNHVVFRGHRGYQCGIHSTYHYSVDTGSLQVLYGDTHSQYHPDISGDIVVWRDYIAITGGRIAIYNLSTNTFSATDLVEPPYPYYHPITNGNVVVWEDGAYDISSSSYIDVLTGDNHQISGNTIVYEKNNGIYGYNIDWQVEFMISQYGSNPHIDGNIVVWEQDGDIYGAVIPDPATPYPVCWHFLTQCHGDTDNTSDVDGSDLLFLKASWYKCHPDAAYNPCADFDRDGCVKGSDFLILKNNWYKPVPADCPPGDPYEIYQ